MGPQVQTAKMDFLVGQRDGLGAAALGQARSLPTLLPLQARSWLADPATARIYDTARTYSMSSARSSLASARRGRSEMFYDSLERSVVNEESTRNSYLSTCRSLNTAGQMSVNALRQRPDRGLLDNMSYHGPLYISINHAENRDALLRTQREGEITRFRAALRAAQLHLGVDDPLVLRMRNILKEADWAVRTCRKLGNGPCSMVKLGNVLSRLKELDLGPRMWENPELAAACARFAAWKASGLQSTDEATRKAACESLAALGDAAIQHAPDLAACFGDSSHDVVEASTHALCQMGQAGASAAASRLQDVVPKVQKVASEALGQMGALGAVHAGAVVTHLNSAEADMRRAVCLTFEKFGTAGAGYASQIAASLVDADARVRRAGCQALASMGKAAAAQADAIATCLTDPNLDVRQAAQRALASIGVARPKSVGRDVGGAARA